MNITLPYDRGFLQAELPDNRVAAVLRPKADKLEALLGQTELVEEALAHPVESLPLHVLSINARRVLILSSDHTRPVPSKIIMPLLLLEIRKGNPNVEIIILIATGCHRPCTMEELTEKYGAEIVASERILMHDSGNENALVDKGFLPSGGKLRLNSLVDWADLLVAEGFIEPHFFAGFSGGRKSVLPGIAAQETVLYNHCASFIAHPKSSTGILQGNPIHEDMVHAAKAANLKFIVNVALNENKQIIKAWAGDPIAAHQQGCEEVKRHALVPAVRGDIVITTNGGYPLDQNIYQAVKGMTAAEACVRLGGVIIMVAACKDGHGGDFFFSQCSQPLSPEGIWLKLLSVPDEKTEPDQWQTQILMRVLRHAAVIMVADPSCREWIKKMHMIPADSLEHALALAEDMVPGGSYVVIPDGVSVIVG